MPEFVQQYDEEDQADHQTGPESDEPTLLYTRTYGHKDKQQDESYMKLDVNALYSGDSI